MRSGNLLVLALIRPGADKGRNLSQFRVLLYEGVVIRALMASGFRESGDISRFGIRPQLAGEFQNLLREAEMITAYSLCVEMH